MSFSFQSMASMLGLLAVAFVVVDASSVCESLTSTLKSQTLHAQWQKALDTRNCIEPDGILNIPEFRKVDRQQLRYQKLVLFIY